MISTCLEKTEEYVPVCTAQPFHEPPTPTTSEMPPKKGKCTLEIYRLRNFQRWFLSVALVLLEMDEIKMEQVQSRAMKMLDYGEKFDLFRQVG